MAPLRRSWDPGRCSAGLVRNLRIFFALGERLCGRRGASRPGCITAHHVSKVERVCLHAPTDDRCHNRGGCYGKYYNLAQPIFCLGLVPNWWQKLLGNPPSDFAAASQNSNRLLQPGTSLTTKRRMTAHAGNFGAVTSKCARLRSADQLMAGVGSSGSSGSSSRAI